MNGPTYELRVRFTTDRPLTETERVALLNACAVQIDDPADYQGESRRAGFRTSIITESLEGVTE